MLQGSNPHVTLCYPQIALQEYTPTPRNASSAATSPGLTSNILTKRAKFSAMQDADRHAGDSRSEAVHRGGRDLWVLAASVGPAPHQPDALQVP